jgi:hypothetical protein
MARPHGSRNARGLASAGLLMVGPAALAARAKNVFARHSNRPYTFASPETTGDEIGVSINVGGQAAIIAAIFSSVAPLHVYYGRALAGEPSGSPVPTFRYANPVMRPLTRLASESGLPLST